MNRASHGQRVALWVALSLGLLTVALVASIAVVGHPTQENVASQETAEPSSGREESPSAAKSRLFDFANYKRLFRKTYSGIIEEMARQKYFFARAFRVFITAMKYRYKQTLYYFALNHLSDATPNELDRMRNHKLEAQLASLQSSANRINDSDDKQAPDSELPALDEEINPGDNIEESLRELVKENQNEPALKELNLFLNGQQDNQEPGASSSSSQSSSPEEELRELPLDKLINTGQDVHLEPEVERKLTGKPSTRYVNPDYKPIELASFGLLDEQQPIQIWEQVKEASDWPAPSTQFNAKNYTRKVLSKLNRLFGRKSSSVGSANDQLLADDEVFVDLRTKTGCFPLPKNQGQCGACYAFAVTSILEWLYCMETGELVNFSEQYMIDCGKDYTLGALEGCNGGSARGAATFVHNFGLELAARYPYSARDGHCPYDPDEPLNTTGYIRVQMENLFVVNESQMGKMVEHGPIMVVLSTDNGFHEYGGGLHGFGCNKARSAHAAVLIGHGREQGREYWLIRNSHSIEWGEQGYYKLDKEAGCIFNQQGFMYGTRNGFDRELTVRRNRDHDNRKVGRALRKSKRVPAALATQPLDPSAEVSPFAFVAVESAPH